MGGPGPRYQPDVFLFPVLLGTSFPTSSSQIFKLLLFVCLMVRVPDRKTHVYSSCTTCFRAGCTTRCKFLASMYSQLLSSLHSSFFHFFHFWSPPADSGGNDQEAL